ncbi:MAG: hypothetical protein CMM07_08330 [Rhodopirellula sp.]|nr:hypothetical protein [Rhodopirellula sp.]
MTEQQSELLISWQRDSKRLQFMHYESAKSFESRSKWLGSFSACLSAIVGTTVFVQIAEDPSQISKVIVGLVSILVAVLTTLQTVLNYGDLASRHRAAGVAYSSVYRSIAQRLAFPLFDRKEIEIWVDETRDHLRDIASVSPTVPNRVWKRLNEVDDHLPGYDAGDKSEEETHDDSRS